LQAFWQWRVAVREQRFRARQAFLSRHLLLLSATFHRPLLNIRRMTLAAASDTHGTWRRTRGGHKTPSPAGLAPCPAEQVRSQPCPHLACAASLRVEGGWVEVLAEWLALGAQPPLRSGLPGPSAAPSTAPSARSMALPSSAAASIAEPGTGGSGLFTANKPQDPTFITAVPLAAGSAVSPSPEGQDAGEPLWAPPSPLLPERLPESGLPFQLGFVGGPGDTYSLADFKRLREEQRGLVANALSEMVAYVRGQVRAQLAGRAVRRG
jgi:hypothetical protein